MKKLKLSLKIIACLVFLSLAIVYVVIPFIAGITATRHKGHDVSNPPNGFKEVIITTEDSIGLAGWYKAPENGIAVMIMHGANNSRDNIKQYAELLGNNKFGVLAIDQRGHGESGGKTNLYGWESGRDVRAAVEFLQKEDDVEHIKALGFSLGAEILLGASSDNPEIESVIAEGATYRSYEDFRELPKYHGLIGHFTPNIVKNATLKIISGQKPPISIHESLKNSPEVNLLLIAGGETAEEADYAKFYSDTVGERGDYWVIQNSGHIQGYQTVPTEYEGKIIEFLQ